MSQITTLTFFRFNTLRRKFWAFQMMQFAHASLQKTEKQVFYKLLGSGKGFGFNPLPDWSVYGLLQVWENEKAADNFFDAAEIFQKYRARASETWTIYMKNISAKGKWAGQNPFAPSAELDEKNKFLAVITRATIKIRNLYDFWKYVPHSQAPLHLADGLIFTKGIGEVPIVQMATFSLWENAEAMKNFAYKSDEHRGAISKTRELKWYKEELFSRFQPFKSIGQWNGCLLLPELDSTLDMQPQS
jgi:heme-degrading monooxygenase HmoA